MQQLRGKVADRCPFAVMRWARDRFEQTQTV